LTQDVTLNAALAGFGLAYLPEDQVKVHVSDGRLVRVLADWCPPFSGCHLYYPSRRQSSAAFTVLVDAIRFKGGRRKPAARTGAGWISNSVNERRSQHPARRYWERLKVLWPTALDTPKADSQPASQLALPGQLQHSPLGRSPGLPNERHGPAKLISCCWLILAQNCCSITAGRTA